MYKKIQSLVLIGIISVNIISSTVTVLANDTINTEKEIKSESSIDTETTPKDNENVVDNDNIESSVENIMPQESQEIIDPNEEIPDSTNLDVIVDNWHVIASNETSIVANKYMGTDKDITIPRTLRGRKLILKGVSDLFPSDLKSIKIQEGNSEDKVQLDAPVWGQQILAFQNKTSLISADLTGLDVSQVGVLDNLFYGCSSLKTVKVNGWNTFLVQRTDRMFSGCSQLTEVDLSGWDTTSLVSMGYMFDGCSSLTNVKGLDVLTKVNNVEYMFRGCNSLTNVSIDGSKLPMVNNISFMFQYCSNLQNVSLKNWNQSQGIYMREMFNSCPKLKTIDLTTFNAKNVTDMQGTFNNCPELTEIKGMENLDVSHVQQMGWLFAASPNLKINVNNWDTSSALGMQAMFSGCTQLENLDLSNWHTSNVTNMKEMFKDCVNLTSLDLSHWNTSHVNNIEGMFLNCSSLTSLNLTDWNTSNVTNMSFLFKNLTLDSIKGIENWNTSNLANMKEMFRDCVNLTSLDLSHWNTSHVNNIEGMFLNCRSLNSLNLTNWNTSNVTNMNWLFEDLTLDSIKGIENWNTSNVTTMQGVFNRCNNLKIINLINWNTSRVNNMSEMFHVDNNIQDRKIMVITKDDKLKSYNYKNDNRVGFKITFDANDGLFDDSTNTKQTEEKFVVSPVENQSILQAAEDLIEKDIENTDYPDREGYVFDKWVLKENTQLSTEESKKAFDLLNSTYEATWVDNMIRVTVPTNTIPFQVVTNLKNKDVDPFISGVLKIKNNSTTRPLKVSVQEFKKYGDTTENNDINELKLVNPEKYNWDTLSGKEALTNMALGIYVKDGLVGKSQYVKEDPLWLIPNNVNKTSLGILPKAENEYKPSECRLSFSAKHAKSNNIIGGRAKGKFELIFIFE